MNKNIWCDFQICISVTKYFAKTSCHQARWERKKGKRCIKLETNFFVKCWHKNFVWSCYKQIKNCIAYINFFTTNCLCKKQVNWRKCRLISDIIEISGRFNTTRFFWNYGYWESFWFFWPVFLCSSLKSLVLEKKLSLG